MKLSHLSLVLFATLLPLACKRETPPKPQNSTQDQPSHDAPLRSEVCGQTLRSDRGERFGDWLAELPDAATQTAHFLAFGDTGTGEPSQFRVANAMQAYCKTHPCDFAIHTGDIFYPQGIGDLKDPRLQERFEAPYAPLHIPIWLTLGNHDYYPPANPDVSVAYTDASPSKAWHMPARWYTFADHGVRFLALDTNQPNAAQETWARQVLEESRRLGERWVIAFGHHPRLSDSRHGDADGTLARWLDRVLCHRVDMLVSGHDHVMEVMKPRCAVHQVVTGAGGAGLYDLKPTDRGSFEVRTFGFVHMEATSTQLQAHFVDDGGKDLCTTTWRKAGSPPVCDRDHVCNGLCAKDIDCAEEVCTKDGRCNFACMDDPDCDAADACACDRNPLICEVRVPGSEDICGCDAACQMLPKVCTVDGVCDPGCPAGRDGDCR